MEVGHYKFNHYVLWKNGVKFGGLEDKPITLDVALVEPSLLELRIDLKSFLETPNFLEPSQHPKSCNGKGCHSRYTISNGN